MRSFTPLAVNTIVLSWLFVGLAIISLITVFVRSRIRKLRFGSLDWCVFSALVVGLLLVGQNTWAIVGEGASEHQEKLSHHELYSAAKSILVNEALWSLSNAMIRVAACLCLFRLFNVYKRFRIAVPTILLLSVIHGLGSLLEMLLICRPLKAQWDPDVQGACSNQMTSFIAIEVTGLIIDLTILGIPAVALHRLNISWREKLTVFCMIDAGAIVLVITALRLKALHLATSADFTYSKSYLGLLSAVGCMLNIILFATPAFVDMFRRFVQGEARLLDKQIRVHTGI